MSIHRSVYSSYVSMCFLDSIIRIHVDLSDANIGTLGSYSPYQDLFTFIILSASVIIRLIVHATFSATIINYTIIMRLIGFVLLVMAAPKMHRLRTFDLFIVNII